MHIITREYQTGSVGLRDEMEYAKEARRTLDFYGLITFESTPGFAFFMLLVVNIKKVSKVFFSAFTIIAIQKDAMTHYIHNITQVLSVELKCASFHQFMWHERIKCLPSFY